MEARMEPLRRVDPGIKARRDSRIVDGVDLGSLRTHFYRDLRWKRVKPLMRPDRPRGTSFDRACVAGCHPFQRGIQKLLGGVGFLRRRGTQKRERVRVPRQDIEARHGLRERLDAEQRAAREACRDACIRAADKWVQSMLPGQHSARGEYPPLDQLAARHLSVGQRLDELKTVLPGILRFPYAKFRCFV